VHPSSNSTSPLRDELDLLLMLCVEQNEAFVSNRQSSLELYQKPQQITFDALLSYLDELSSVDRVKAVAAAIEAFNKNPNVVRREIAREQTVEALFDAGGWPLINSLVLIDGSAHIMATLATESEKLRQIEELAIIGGMLDSNLCQIIARMPNLQSLQIVSCRLTERGSELVYSNTLLSKLKRLYGGQLHRISDPGSVKLESVDCDGTADIVHLLNNIPSIREVHFHVSDKNSRDVIKALCESTNLSQRLISLSLSIGIDDESLAGLARCPLVQLKRLSLPSNQITANGVSALKRSSFVSGLEFLNLTHNELGDSGWEHIAELQCRELKLLNLASTSAGERGASALAFAKNLRLEHLDISGNSIDAKGFNALCTSGTLNSVEHLDVSDNPIDSNGTLASADKIKLSKLRHLFISKLGGVGGTAFVANSAFRELQSLSISDDDTTETIEALAKAGHLVKLQRLSFFPFTDTGARALGSAHFLTDLRSLSVLGPLSSVGIGHIADSVLSGNLWELGLDSCPIGDEGAIRIAESRLLNRLTDLRVFGCGISMLGSQTLANSSILSRLRWLSIEKRLLEPWRCAPNLSKLFRARVTAALSIE
jgi:hypothetical protein